MERRIHLIFMVANFLLMAYTVDPKNLEKPNGKKRQHVDAVCQALRLNLAQIDITPKQIADDFDKALCRAIAHLLQPQHTT